MTTTLGAVSLPCGCYQRIAGYGRDTEAWAYCEAGMALRIKERLLGYRITDATMSARCGVPEDQAAVDCLIRSKRRVSGKLDRHLDILRHRA